LATESLMQQRRDMRGDQPMRLANRAHQYPRYLRLAAYSLCSEIFRTSALLVSMCGCGFLLANGREGGLRPPSAKQNTYWL
jgi:hypothetical protein